MNIQRELSSHMLNVTVGRDKFRSQSGEARATQSDAITPVQSVPQSVVAILSERKDRTKLGLSKYAADAAERAAESDGNLALSRNVRDVAAVGSSLWPEDQARDTILILGILIGTNPPRRISDSDRGVSGVAGSR